MDSSDHSQSFFNGCIRTYGAATRHMMKVWEDVTDKPMETLSGSPKERFRKALRYFVQAMERGDALELRAELGEAMDDDENVKSLIEDSLASPDEELAPDVDDVPPSVFKEAIWMEALERAGDEIVDVDLDEFLRAVVARVINEMGWKRRFNVGGESPLSANGSVVAGGRRGDDLGRRRRLVSNESRLCWTRRVLPHQPSYPKGQANQRIALTF